MFQLLLPAVEGQVPVGGFAHHGHGTGDGRARVDEVGGVERRSAFLALVAVSALGAAVGAGARHVAVCQELPGLLVVELLGSLLHKLAVVVKFAEELGGGPAVCVGSGAAIDVERDTELLEGIFDDVVVTVHYVLGRHALLLGLYGDGDTVLVAASNHQDVASLETQEAGVDVGRHVDAGKVADVYRPVGVRQRRGDKCSLEFLLHVKVLLKPQR